MLEPIVFGILDWLQLDTSDLRLSLAICLGFLLGITPWFTLHGMVLLALLLILRLNPIATLVAFGISAAVSWPFDESFHRLGLALLTIPGWHRMWSGLYHAPLIPYTRFNNSVVMGRLLIALLLVGPLYAVVRRVLSRCRSRLIDRIQRTAAWEFWATTRIFRHYASYQRTQTNG
jgi:uncharacterized protein (TIGR03546 family)